MPTVSLKMGTQELDWLAPSTREALQIAQQEAARLQTEEVSPEILLLGVLKQGYAGVRRVLSDLGMDLQALRAQAAQVFGMPRNAEAGQPLDDDLPLSEEVQNCIDWAIAFATYMHAPLMLPEHLLLGALRHQRTQPLLALLLPAEGAIPAPIMESTEHNYTRAVDQFIHSRVREWSTVSLSSERSRQVLRGFERPTVLFTDITGEDTTRRALQEAVDFLRIPTMARSQEKNPLYGAVLVGSPRRNRTLLVRAVAGEAVVPLFSLSISALAGMLSDIAHGSMQLEDEDFELSEEERTLLTGEEIILRGRHMIAYVFDQARKAAPCVLLLDDIDAIDRLSKEEERQLWLNQVLVEMDRRNDQPPMVVIAATEHPDSLDQSLLHPVRFQQRVVLEDSMFTQTRPCPSCKHTTQPGWKRCMFCGTLLMRVCPHCNVLLPEVAGAYFCFECGGSLK